MQKRAGQASTLASYNIVGRYSVKRYVTTPASVPHTAYSGMCGPTSHCHATSPVMHTKTKWPAQNPSPPLAAVLMICSSAARDDCAD